MDLTIVKESIEETNEIIKQIDDIDSSKKMIVWGVILNNLLIKKLFFEKNMNLLDIRDLKSVNIANVSLSEFYNLVNPNTHNDRILLFVYWLKGNSKKDQFEPKDIEECYKKAIIKSPKNLPDSMRKLASGKKALLIRPEKGIYQLSNMGINYVNRLISKKDDDLND